MNRRTLWAIALLGATALTGPALAADLYKAPPPAPPPPPADWSGIYTGIEGGYGWGHDHFNGTFNQLPGFGGAGNIANILSGNTDILFPEFTGAGLPGSISMHGGLVGGFVGAQKQWGSWVLGIEADYDFADIKKSANASATELADIPLLDFFSPTVTGTAFVGTQVVDITGTAFLPGNCPSPNACAGGTPVAPGTVIPAGGALFVAQTVPGFNANNIGLPGNTNAPGVIGVGLTNSVTVGANSVVTVRLPFFSVPGQNAPVSGIVNADVLAQDFALADVTRSIHVDTKIDELGSVRGKVGFTPWTNWLLYGTGGLAWAHQQTTIDATETLNFGEGDIVGHTVNFAGGGTMLGWSLGAGVDFKVPVDQGSAWVFGLEYLHYDFPKNTFTLADNGVSASFVNSHETVDAIKGRISYLFSIH